VWLATKRSPRIRAAYLRDLAGTWRSRSAGWPGTACSC
jgi:hypothetical protein